MFRIYLSKTGRTSRTILSILVLATFTFPSWARHNTGHTPGSGGGGGGSGGGGSAVCIAKKTSEDSCTGTTPSTLDLAGYTPVFEYEFGTPISNPDEMNSVDYTIWSTRFPFGDWKNNTAGPDDMWNVNTTGLEPGIGWENNHYPNMQTFLDQLVGKEIYSIVDCEECSTGKALKIKAYKNPWKNQINKRNDYLAGVISSHSKPGTSFGLEYRYGYLEFRLKLPEQGNGFRAAGWAYGDNGYYNAVYPRPIVSEIDAVEYLPNTRCGTGTPGEDVVLQSDLFKLVNDEDLNIQTWQTIFNSYHTNIGTGSYVRTPTNWHFNHESPYGPGRCAVNNTIFGNGVADAIDYGNPLTGFVTYGVLWEADRIEWYVNGILAHTALGQNFSGDYIKVPMRPPTANVPISSTRKYIIANLAMGNPNFEGSVDASLFDAINGGGPELLIDYIRLSQKNSVHPPTAVMPGNSYWCGLGVRTCDAQP